MRSVLAAWFVTAAASAAQLDIVRIEIGPDGATVECAGTLPPGDEVVDGLPLGIDGDSLSVTIAGLAAPPALRLALPATPPPPPIDAALNERLLTAQRDFDHAQATIGRAALRAQLARAALDPPGAIEVIASAPPGAAMQDAVAAFVTGNAAAARGERAEALRAREAARSELAAIDELIDAARPRPIAHARLPLPGAGGRQVSLRYRIDRARWAPVYRVEVADGRATLVREALIDVPLDVDWSSGALELTTRATAIDPLLGDLQVTVLSLGDEVANPRVGGGKRRAIGRFGGSKASESATDSGLRQLKQRQNTDGSWGSGPWRLHGTALATAGFLASGYDHRMPSKYKTVVARSVAWLCDNAIAPDLSGQALATMALAEALAMTNDDALRAAATRALAALQDRAWTRDEATTALYRRGAMAGPEIAGWITLALKASAGAGLDIGDGMQRCRALAGELIGHPDRDEARIARLLLAVLGGDHAAAESQAVPVDEWLAEAPQWLAQGRPELVYFATLALFQRGGDAWALWQATTRDRLVAVIAAVGDDGDYLGAVPSPLGETGAASLVMLPLMVYYRYAALGTVDADAIAAQSPLVDVAQAASGWPLRFAAGAARLRAGQRQRIALDRIPLPGAIALRAEPAADDGAWRTLTTTNPLTTPLMSGCADVVVDGERIGDHPLAFTAPGAELILPLGRDQRVRVVRSERTTETEAWGKRVHTLAIGFRVEAPAGLYPSIAIDEPIPRPADPAIQVRSLTPPIEGEAMDRRLVEDPAWHLALDLADGSAEGGVTYEIRHPQTLRAVSRAGEATAQETKP